MWEYGILSHDGVKGMEHGVQRWQNSDKSLTPAGVIHYRLLRQARDAIRTANKIGRQKREAKALIREAERAFKKAEKADNRWVKKNSKSIERKAERETRREVNDYARQLSKTMKSKRKDGKDAAAYVNLVNRKMAELMTQKVSDLRTPSGRSVMFVANRGSRGVSLAIYTSGYDTSKLRNGVRADGKIAYRKESVNVREYGRF